MGHGAVMGDELAEMCRVSDHGGLDLFRSVNCMFEDWKCSPPELSFSIKRWHKFSIS